MGPTSSLFSRFKMLRTDLDKHGYTGDCMRCTRISLGDHKTSVNHTEKCREEMYQKLHKARVARFMKALRNSPEFVRRLRVIEDHELEEEKGHVPEALDDDLGIHLIEEDAIDDDDTGHPSSVVKALIAAGVARYDAICAVQRMTASTPISPTTFHEFYGRGAIVDVANNTRRDLNTRGLKVVDLGGRPS